MLRLAVSWLSGLREAVPKSGRCYAGQATKVRMHAVRCKVTRWLAVAHAFGRVLPVAARGS